jgi:hypothetical protein
MNTIVWINIPYILRERERLLFNTDMLDEVVVHAWYTCGHGYNVYNQINIRPKLMWESLDDN